VLKRAKPDIASKSLLRWTKASIIIAGVVGGVVVSSGIDYVVLVNTVFFLKAALIIPLGLAIFWSRMTSTAFVASLLLAVAVGYPVRETVGELQGIIALEAVSLVVSVGISLVSRQKFDFATLHRRDALAEGPPGDDPSELDEATKSAGIVDPDPVR
jgi:urea-proton symporter